MTTTLVIETQAEAQRKTFRRPHPGHLADSTTAPNISTTNPRMNTTSPTVRTITNFSNRNQPISETLECQRGLRLVPVRSGLVLRLLGGMQSTKLWMHQASAQATKATMIAVAVAATVAVTVAATAVEVTKLVKKMKMTAARAADAGVSPSVPRGFQDR